MLAFEPPVRNRCDRPRLLLRSSIAKLYIDKLFHIPPIPPEPHDSWVVGDEPYVSLHFMGAEKYAR